MTEPRRLLNDETISALSRAVLEAGRVRREPLDARERVWMGITAGVAAGAAGTNASGIVALLAKSKLFIIGALLGIGGLAGFLALHRNEAAPSPEPSRAMLVRAPSPAVVDAGAPPALPVGAEMTTPPAPPVVHAKPVATSSMREEVTLLEDARAALASGDVELARTKLADSRKRFPRSRLEQERDALDIRITDASGDHERAATLVRTFVDRYPNSPLRSSLEALVR